MSENQEKIATWDYSTIDRPKLTEELRSFTNIFCNPLTKEKNAEQAIDDEVTDAFVEFIQAIGPKTADEAAGEGETSIDVYAAKTASFLARAVFYASLRTVGKKIPGLEDAASFKESVTIPPEAESTNPTPEELKQLFLETMRQLTPSPSA